MSGVIPYGRQHISDEDIQAVVDVLKSDFITQGPVIDQFEQAVAAYCGAEYAVAVSSGTAALHLACLAAGLSPGDLLWTSPNTFLASANCGRYCGADVDFVDIDPKTYNLSPAELGRQLDLASDKGLLPNVVIPVHLSGQSCEMATISDLAARYGFMVIEDASHAIGGSYQGKKVGACQYADMAVFSFHPVKVMTSGEGGMILTNRKELYQTLRRLRTHGMTRDVSEMTEESHGPWYYQQIDLGFNYRITDIQAALGLSQLQRLDDFVDKRRQLAARYDDLLSSLPVITPWQHPESQSAWHLYIIRLQLDQIQKTHRQVFEELREAGIGVNLHYIPVHTQPYYQALGFEAGDFPEAEAYYGEAISLPLFYTLSEADQDRVVETLKRVLTVPSACSVL